MRSVESEEYEGEECESEECEECEVISTARGLVVKLKVVWNLGKLNYWNVVVTLSATY